MPHLLRSAHGARPARFLLVLWAALALGCAKKTEDAAPAPPPSPPLTATWGLTKQVITEFKPDGTVQATSTFDTYLANGEIWRYVFGTDGRFDYTYQGQTLRKGTYAHGNGRLVQTNDPGVGNTPTVTLAIATLSATELVLVAGSRTTTGRESATTWAKR